MRIEMFRKISVNDLSVVRIPGHRMMLRNPPEIEIFRIHCLKHLAEGIERRKERIVHKDKLIILCKLPEAQVEDRVAVAAYVKSGIDPAEDFIRVPGKPCPAFRGDDAVDCDIHEGSVLPQIIQHIKDILIHDPVFVVEEKDHASVF